MSRVAPCESIVVVTRQTQLEELTLRFGTRGQARFYIQQQALQRVAVAPENKKTAAVDAAAAFAPFQAAHDTYRAAVDHIVGRIPRGVKHQVIERSFLPTFKFGERDLVIVIGPDGLVVNTAKYVQHQPILAFNPDPSHIDGVLLPFAPREAELYILVALAGTVPTRALAMVAARLDDGQELLAVNDLFIGARSHVSARYRLELRGISENHISSGIIVSTGAGSTGWLQSVVTGAFRVTSGVNGRHEPEPPLDAYRREWSSNKLYFAVREPFPSRASQTRIVFGTLEPGESLQIGSQMADGGVIFSDGVEADHLTFNSPALATIALADRHANLIVPA